VVRPRNKKILILLFFFWGHQFFFVSAKNEKKEGPKRSKATNFFYREQLTMFLNTKEMLRMIHLRLNG